MAKNIAPAVITREIDPQFCIKTNRCNNTWISWRNHNWSTFQPIFVSNYDDFRAYFGGLNATKVKDTGSFI